MTEHPCGSVPVSGWSVSIWYCHQHQAWWGFQSAYIQSGDDAVAPLSSDGLAWGPFDSFTDVLAWIHHRVTDLELDHLDLVEAPWEQGRT